MIRYLGTLLLLVLTDSSHERFYKQPGSFSYALNSVRDVMDVTPDGKIAVSLENDSVSVHPALLTTFDPTSGNEFDSKVFGFGPLEVRVKQTSNGTRVVVLTSQGGPRAIYLFDLNPAGKLTLLGNTQLTTSNADGGSNLLLSDRAPVGFAVVALNPGQGQELVSFSLVDGSVLGRFVVPGPFFANNRMAMVETSGKRILMYLKGSDAVEVLDAFDPAHPADLGSVNLSSTQPWSGVVSISIAFTSDARFAFVTNPYSSLEFIDLETMQVVNSIQGNRSFGRIVVHEDNNRRLLAVQCATGGHSCVLLVDATDPLNPAVINQLDLTSNSVVDLAFSKDGARLFILGAKVYAFDLPSFKKVWDQTSSFSFVKS